MSCWRVLQLSDEPRGETIPPLLIKPLFSSSAYKVFLTDLSNIWSEDLDLSGIVRRASEIESPIEISERDTAQLAILFENLQRSLDYSDDASCIIARDEPDGLTLVTTISLPEPLDSLSWKFHLRKRTAVTLKDELILPLLVSSHIQHVRISGLLSVISDKDRALTRLVEQYESSNLDLAAAFPSIGNVKSSRRLVKREQAARHIPGLQNFDPHLWNKETADMVDGNVSTLGLFQEALSECTPKVPPKLKSDGEDDPWWRTLNTSANIPKRTATAKAEAQSRKAPIPVRPAISDSETEEEETEDEFETHENFKSRDLAKKPEPASINNPASHGGYGDIDVDGTTADEDMDVDQDEDNDEDLDAPPKRQIQIRRAPRRAQSSTPEPSSPKETLPVPEHSPPAKNKAKSFKIGGKSKKTDSTPPMSQEGTESARQSDTIPTRSKPDEDGIGAKPAKKSFKIGGRSRQQMAPGNEEATVSSEARASRDTPAVMQSASVEPPAPTVTKAEKQASPVEEEREETEEEKVERKRRELKRRNDELAKKQAQSKKKKRF